MSLVNRLNLFLQKLDHAVSLIFGRGFPPEALCIAGIQKLDEPSNSTFSLSDIIGDGFLWAVPKHRRTLEKRLKRKYGSEKYRLKILVPKNNLRICNQCGNYHEVGILCPNCYENIRKETEQMQTAIQEKLGLNPVEKNVVVLYDGEQQTDEQEQNYVVEMKKPRPAWFSKNLLQSTTQKPAETKDVKPEELG